MDQIKASPHQLVSTGGIPVPQPGIQHCRVLAFTEPEATAQKLALLYPWEKERKRAPEENRAQRIADVARGRQRGSRHRPLAVAWMKAFPGLSSIAILCREAAAEG